MGRYTKISNYAGIRKDNATGKYLATKYIGGKEFSKSFTSLKLAANWRASFHPSFPDKSERDILSNNQGRLNGEDFGYTFADVWELYKENYLSSLETSTREQRLAKTDFIAPLMKYKMVEITATLLDRFMVLVKKDAIKNKSKRCNFDNDLKNLKALLNWYRINYDPFFVNPVLPRHKAAGFIKRVTARNKKLKPEELVQFFRQLDPFWRDFAETQFYLGARVSEVAGLQVDSVSMSEKEIKVQDVAVWSYRTKKFVELKPRTKNNEVSYASMNSKLFEIMTRRLPLAKNSFVFHDQGSPLVYKQIQYQYNKALRKAGLADKYSSTHIMRHSMGTITRRVTGSADMAQAVTRHKDIQMAQQYASLPTEANRRAVNQVFEYLNEIEKGASS